MSRRAIKIGLMAALVFLIITVAALQIKTPAYAGSRLQLTYDDAPTRFVAEGQEVTRTVYVDESLYPDLVRITYDVVSSTSNDIMYQTLRPTKGAVTIEEGGTLTLERNDVLVDKSDLVRSGSGKKAYSFTVKNDHCCAFIFTVYRDTGDDEDVATYDSEVLYLDNVDSRPPTFTYELNPFLNSVTCTFDDRSSVCASSGTKSFTVYKTNMDTGVKTEFLTSSDINRNTASFTIDSGSGHYNYYVTATDYVGNTSEEILILRYDVDELIRSADNAFNTIATSPESWSDGFKNKLTDAYNEYTVYRNGEATDEQMQAAAEKLSAVLTEYRGYINDKLNDRKNVTLEKDNTGILSSELTVKNLYKACGFVKFGETGTVVIGVYKADREKEDDVSNFEPCDMKITDVYAFTVRVFATEQGNVNEKFSVPLELALSVGEYNQIAAVQVVTKDGKTSPAPCHIKEYTNGNLVLEVENTSGTVYLYVSAEQKKDNKLLYLLFLLVIPVASGATCLVIYHKRKKAKENNNGRKEADHQ